MNKGGDWKGEKGKVGERRGEEREVRKEQENGCYTKLPFLSWVPSRLGSLFDFFPHSRSITPLCFLYVHLTSLSLPYTILLVVTVFLSAVCSAWHSVWRMMAIPEGGVMQPAPPTPQSHPGPSSHHSLYTTTMRPVQRRGEREGVLILPPLFEEQG